MQRGRGRREDAAVSLGRGICTTSASCSCLPSHRQALHQSWCFASMREGHAIRGIGTAWRAILCMSTSTSPCAALIGFLFHLCLSPFPLSCLPPSPSPTSRSNRFARWTSCCPGGHLTSDTKDGQIELKRKPREGEERASECLEELRLKEAASASIVCLPSLLQKTVHGPQEQYSF